MVFTKSLLIKALGGVAGVGGTTVGVLAGTGVFNKTETTPATGESNVDKSPAGDPSVNKEAGSQGEVVSTGSSPQGNSDGVPGSQDSKGQGATEQQPKQAGSGDVPQDGQAGDRSQQVDSGLPKDAQENNKANTQQNSQPGVDGRQVNVNQDEHRSGSTSEISVPGTSGNPVQGEGAGSVYPKPQQSIPTLPESPNRDSDGQSGGNSGGSSLPNAGATPGAVDTHEPGTGGDGQTGERTESQDSPTTNTVTQPQTEIEKANAKLRTLNIPETFKFTDSNRTIQNSISKEELKKIKFEESGDDGVDSEETNIQLKIEILSGSKKTAYGLNDDEEEETDVTKDLLFTFSGFSKEINLDSDDGFKLYPNTNPEFKVEDNGLEKLWGKHSDLTGKVGINKKDNSPYAFESTTTLKYSLDSGVSFKTLNTPTTSGTIDVEGDKENYNQGVKVTFREKVTGTGSDSLEANTCYEIKYDETQGWYLSKKNEGTNEKVVTRTDGQQKGIQGAGGGGADTTDPNSVNSPQPDGSPSPSGLSSEQQLNNNQQEQVPTVDTNSLSKTDASDSDTVDNEEDTSTDPQVKATNSKLEKLKIPKKCRFTDNNKDEPLECSLSKDEFKEISFEGEEVDESLLDENGESFVMKLIIERLSESKKTDYENKTDLLFTFKDFKGKSEKGCKRGFKVNNGLTLYENTNPEFKESDEGGLESLWTAYTQLTPKVGLSNANCDEKGSGSSCVKFDQKKSQSTKFSVDKGKTIKEVNIPEESQQKAKAFAEARGYSQGFRFLFKEDVTFDNDNTLPAGGYEIVYKNDNGWYLSQVSTDTAENWNEKDSDGNPCLSEEE